MSHDKAIFHAESLKQARVDYCHSRSSYDESARPVVVRFFADRSRPYLSTIGPHSVRAQIHSIRVLIRLPSSSRSHSSSSFNSYIHHHYPPLFPHSPAHPGSPAPPLSLIPHLHPRSHHRHCLCRGCILHHSSPTDKTPLSLSNHAF